MSLCSPYCRTDSTAFVVIVQAKARCSTGTSFSLPSPDPQCEVPGGTPRSRHRPNPLIPYGRFRRLRRAALSAASSAALANGTTSTNGASCGSQRPSAPPVLAWALEPKLVESVGMESEPVHDISECLPEVAYKLSSGPWISCWVRIGYSPAEQPAARVMQVSGGPFLSHRAEPHTMTAPHAAPLPTGPGCAVREKADELCSESIKGREHWWYFKGSRSGAS